MNLHIDWIIIFNIAGLLNGLFLALVIVGTKRRVRIPRVILAALIGVIVMLLINAVLLQSNTYLLVPHLFGIFPQFTYLLGPLLFFYVKALITPGFTFKKKYFLHFIPFIVRYILAIPLIMQGAEEKLRIVRLVMNIANWKYIIVPGVSHNLIYLSIYLYLTIRLLRKHNRNIKNTYSSIAKMRLKWMNHLVFCYVSLLVAYFAFYIVFCSLSLSGEGLLLLTTRLLSIWETVLVFIIGYKGLTQPEIFSGDDAPVPVEKYRQSTLSAQEAQKYRKKLLDLMEAEKPFLRENLSIKELSEQLSISPRHLSQVLNERLGQNFYDFINRHRVEEAKKRLIETSDQKMSILSIGYDVGFNSKSAFNTVFKKYTKMTPSQYRKRNLA